MFAFLLAIHVIVSVALAIVILLQSSKGGGMAGVFGGGGGASSGTLFSGRGVASFLHKITIALASAYLILCLILGSKIFKDQRQAVEQSLTQKARSQRTATSSSSVIPAVPGAFEAETVAGEEPAKSDEAPKPDEEGPQN